MRLLPSRQAPRSPASAVGTPGNCLPAWGLSPRLETSGRRPRTSLSPSPTAVRPPREELAVAENLAGHGDAPAWPVSESAAPTLSRRRAADDSFVSPFQSKTKSTPGDASFPETSPDPQSAVLKYSGHRRSPTSPPPRLESR